jgi:hypothetical protein|tara:strand:+ start:1443 stop:2594 length:1152 start_codon:yes stop_codon:yes gene_type:complete
MNLSESISNTLRKLEKINLVEGSGHLEHPEDLVFLGDEQGARQAITQIENTIKQPGTITIKWDGYPALIFGRGKDGRFSIMDKHMFNKKDGTGRQVFSPEEFKAYDDGRQVNRGDLYSIIARVWPGLEASDRGATGFYWGDLLFSEPLVENDGIYTFKANPGGITYTVVADSEVGHLLSDKQAAIAVHQFIPPNAMTTDEAESLNGSIGTLKQNSEVAIVPSKMPITPNLKLNSDLKKKAEAEINQNGAKVKALFQTAPQARNGFNMLFTVFVNKKIVSGDLKNLYNDFIEFVTHRKMTDSMRNKLMMHFEAHKEGIIGAFKIWIALYNLKQNVVEQLDNAAKSSPVKGFLDDGTETHEGFVANGLKFVNRMGFARQNLAARG